MNMTRRQYLMVKTSLASPDSGWLVIAEAVSSTAIEHPEWDMEEVRTWEEWERPARSGRDGQA